MRRKHQNSTGTFGTVDQAAASICAGGRLGRLVDVAQQQQRITQIGLVRLEARARRRILGIGAQQLQRRVRLDAAHDALAGTRHEFEDAGHRLIDRARGDETEQPRDLDLGRSACATARREGRTP